MDPTLLHFYAQWFNTAKFFQIWLTVAGYDAYFFYYVCDFGQSETEKYFVMVVKGLNQFV